MQSRDQIAKDLKVVVNIWDFILSGEWTVGGKDGSRKPREEETAIVQGRSDGSLD